MKKVLVPAAAIGVVVILLGVLLSMNDNPNAGGAAKSNLPFPLDAPEWKKLDNGMRVWDVKEGSGEPCPPGATVTIHYTGWVKDGSVFDSSKPRGEPNQFSLNMLIPGWKVGIPGMKPGGTRRLEIPSDLGYGPSGSPPKIPPNATLWFEVELISVP